jgi:acetyltransferase-like isoleucine patch superfamily enzyme
MMDKLEEFEALREQLRREQGAYVNENITVGDFTYGIPKIRSCGEGAKLSIGKFCSIGENVTIMLGGEHRPDWNTTYPFNVFLDNFSDIKGNPATKGDVTIGNDVWIASGAKIMSGVTIGDGAVIGANALVTKDVEPYDIVGGVPAKSIKKRFSKEKVKVMLEMQWWNWPDQKIVEAVPYLQSNDISGLIQLSNDPGWQKEERKEKQYDKEAYALKLEWKERDWHEIYDRKSMLLRQEINRLLQEKTAESRQRVVGIFGNQELFEPYTMIPDFAVMYLITYIYLLEQQNGLAETILDHGDTMEELNRYFFRWRMLLYRLDFEIEEDVEEQFLSFLQENKVSTVMIEISLNFEVMRPAELTAKMEKIFEEHGMDDYLESIRKVDLEDE